MKKIGKIKFNSDKLMKDEELIMLRGGYGYVKCMFGNEPCGPWYEGMVGDCSMAAIACTTMCGGEQYWDNNICVG